MVNYWYLALQQAVLNSFSFSVNCTSLWEEMNSGNCSEEWCFICILKFSHWKKDTPLSLFNNLMNLVSKEPSCCYIHLTLKHWKADMEFSCAPEGDCSFYMGQASQVPHIAFCMLLDWVGEVTNVFLKIAQTFLRFLPK